MDVLWLVYAIVHTLWYIIDVHKRWGPWKCSEPPSHYKFAMKTVWIVGLFGIGGDMIEYLMNVDPVKKDRFLLPFFEAAPEYHLPSKNLVQDLAYALIAFYLTDFARYWGHRIGHWAFFYYTFPFSHAHHHNQIFINPFTTSMSPLCHLASWGTYLPCILFAYYGLHRAALINWFASIVPSITQHMGFDPLPWLTRWNHYYFAGAIPWIPLYHMYHHNPFVKAGNFGNTSVLFDYLHGTVTPECIYHIEHGCAPAWLAEKFEDPQKLDKLLHSMYTAGKGKNRLEMNDSFDSSIFKAHFL